MDDRQTPRTAWPLAEIVEVGPREIKQLAGSSRAAQGWRTTFVPVLTCQWVWVSAPSRADVRCDRAPDFAGYRAVPMLIAAGCPTALSGRAGRIRPRCRTSNVVVLSRQPRPTAANHGHPISIANARLPAFQDGPRSDFGVRPDGLVDHA